MKAKVKEKARNELANASEFNLSVWKTVGNSILRWNDFKSNSWKEKLKNIDDDETNLERILEIELVENLELDGQILLVRYAKAPGTSGISTAPVTFSDNVVQLT